MSGYIGKGKSVALIDGLVPAANLSDVDSAATSLTNLGITSTAAELNILDGVTATTSELNYLDITALGTTEASKAVTTDASGNVVINNGRTTLTANGEPFSLYVQYNNATSGVFIGGDAAGRLQFSNSGGGALAYLDSTGLGIGGTPTVNNDTIGTGTVASRIYSSNGGTVYTDWTSGSNAFRLNQLGGNATFSNYTTNGATQFSQSGTGSISMNWSVDSSPLLQLYNASTGSSASMYHRMNVGGRYVDYAVSYAGQYAFERGSSGGIISKFNDFDNHIFRDSAVTTTQLTIDNSGITSYGHVSDEYGNVRDVPAVGTKTTAYTLQAADAGRYVQTSSGATITIPNLVFSQGDVVTIINAHTSDSTITCSTTYSFITGDVTNKPSVTLAARGMCTLLFTSGNIVYMSGNLS